MQKSIFGKKREAPLPKGKTIKSLCKVFLLGIWGVGVACVMSALLMPIKEEYLLANNTQLTHVASQSKYAICGAGFFICIFINNRDSREVVQHGGFNQPSLGSVEKKFEDPKKSVAFRGSQFPMPKVFVGIGGALLIFFLTTFFLLWGFIFITVQQFIRKLLKSRRFSVDFVIASVVFPLLLNLIGFLIL